MPESKGRKAAEAKASGARKAAAQTKRQRSVLTESPAWIAPAFVTVGLIGVAWLVLYYIASPYIPFMAALGSWNMLIGMGLMALSFIIAMFWK